MNDEGEWRAAIAADERDGVPAGCGHRYVPDGRGGGTCAHCGDHITPGEL
ncbi:MAG: hypothetical protein WDA07_14285 [Leucobacter sp.]